MKKKKRAKRAPKADEKMYRLEAKREGSPCWFIACETRNKHKLKRKYNKLVERGFRVEVEII